MTRSTTSATARGYGVKHQALRRRWDAQVQRGQVPCGRCGRPILPGTPWDLSHPDDNKDLEPTPWHAACNRAFAAGVTQVRKRRSVGPAVPTSPKFDDLTHPAPYRSPHGQPWSRMWAPDGLTRTESIASQKEETPC